MDVSLGLLVVRYERTVCFCLVVYFFLNIAKLWSTNQKQIKREDFHSKSTNRVSLYLSHKLTVVVLKARVSVVRKSSIFGQYVTERSHLQMN
jgi:hypothetical protein